MGTQTLSPPIPAQWAPLQAQADCELQQSFNIAGICCGFADGTARMIGSGVTQRTWAQLMLPNDGSPLAADANQ